MDKVWLSWSQTVCVHLVNLVKKKVMQTGNGERLPSEWKLCFTTTAKMFQSFTLKAIVVTFFLFSAPLGKLFVCMQVQCKLWVTTAICCQPKQLQRDFWCNTMSRFLMHTLLKSSLPYWVLWLLATVACSLPYDQGLHNGRRPVSRAW